MNNILEIVNNFYKYSLPLFKLIEERIEGETEKIYKEIGKKIYETEINNLLHTDESKQTELYKELKQLLYILRMIEKAIDSLDENIIKEDEDEYEIFVDMDGVVADFNKRFFDIADMLPSEFEEKYGKDKFWDLINDNKKEFWVEIPMMWDARSLIDYVKKYPYKMLTAPSSKKDSLIGKTIWLRMHTNKLFGGNRPEVIFRAAKNKQEFSGKNKILIDDRAKTIDQWNAKGGIGILHTSAENTIKQLKKLGL